MKNWTTEFNNGIMIHRFTDKVYIYCDIAHEMGYLMVNGSRKGCFNLAVHSLSDWHQKLIQIAEDAEILEGFWWVEG